MSEWKQIAFDEIFEIPLRNGLTKPSKIRGRGLKMVNMKEIFAYDKISDNVDMELVPVEEKERNSLLKYDDLLFARQSLVESGAGKVAIFKGRDETVFESHLIRCRIDLNLCSPDFVYYYWKSPQGKGNMSTIVTQTAAAGIKGSVLQTLLIPTPPLPEQNAIASILSSLDDKIDLLHRQNATLEKMAETLFRQWFVEEAKEEWREIKITDLFEVKDGTHDSPKQKEFGKKLITSKHLSKHSIDFQSAYFISEEDFEQINKRSKVDTDDILFSMIGTIGIIYLEQSNDIDYAIKNIGLFKTSQNRLWKYFTVLWLKCDLGNEFIHENRSGSTQEYISLGSLRSIKFSIPSLEIVELFNKDVEPLFQKIKSNQTQIRTLTALRDTLLPKLMSGEVRVL
jgi:type I restriction enzyme S subunit